MSSLPCILVTPLARMQTSTVLIFAVLPILAMVIDANPVVGTVAVGFPIAVSESSVVAISAYWCAARDCFGRSPRALCRPVCVRFWLLVPGGACR